MAQGNGTGQSTMGQGGTGDGSSGFVNKMSHVIGDIGRYFKDPKDLTPIPGAGVNQNRQQNGDQNLNDNQFTGTGQGNNVPQGSTKAGATNAPETLENPLDVYAGLFDNKPKLDKDGKPVQGPPEAPKFKLDSKTIADAAGKMDFTAGLPPEIADKLQNGQPLTSAEQLQMQNHVGAKAYSHAMEHVTALADRYIDMRLQHEQQGLSTQVNKLLARSKTLNNPAIASNPALKEHFESITERISTKYPDASPEWVAERAEQYFIDMAKAINPALGNTQQDNTEAQKLQKEGATVRDGKVFDWEGYLK